MLLRMPVPHSAARKIQEMILSGELKPGEKVPSQRAFSQTLKLSRASLREALLTLETLGLLRTEPGRGTFVTEAGPAASRNMARWRYASSYPVVDVFQTRFMLEGRIVGLSTPALSESELTLLETATDCMERNWEAGDLLANVEADLEFHAIIALACPNKMLVDLYQHARTQLTQTQMQPIPITQTERMRASIDEHRRIIAALRKRDPAAASLAMRDHIRNTARCAGVDLPAEPA
jgi:GntR family transcriptional repressor for pyruvate dehydrogenase complex